MRYRDLLGFAFVVVIVMANWATTEYGVLDFGPVAATAGTLFAGLAFVIRDSIQDYAGRWAAMVCIACAALISYLIADPAIALASAVALAVSELVDMAVYTPLRKNGYVPAAIASNIVGAVVDTFLFLWIAGFPVTQDSVTGQVVVKIAVTLVAVAIVVGIRAVPRQPVQ